MNNPSPLIPQGTLQSKMQGRSNVQLAVITIVAIHVVFFGGLLLQGCKRNTPTAEGSGTTETNVTDTLTYAPIDTNAGMYYTSPGTLPSDTGTTQVAAATSSQTPDYSLGSSTPSNLEPSSSTIGFGAPAAIPTEMKDYTVVKGDSFYKIAKANNVTLAALTRANPNIEPTRLRVGAKINIPVSETRPTSSNGGGASTAGGDGSTYTVKSGDTLTKIAKNHGTTVSALRAANGLKVSRLLVGQKIKLPASTQRSSTNGGTPLPESAIIQ